MRISQRESGSTAGIVGLGLASVLATASAAYFLDPVSGNRRRALVRDKLHRVQRQSRVFMEKANRDARQRAHGLYREVSNRLHPVDVEDDTLLQRVRTELGRLTAHPKAIEVECQDGLVCLSGDVLRHEANTVLRGVAGVNGVRLVEDGLQRHDSAEGISSLQGEGRRRARHRLEYLQSNWSPAPRVLAGAVASVMILSAFARRSPIAYALTLGGAVLLGRAISNAPLSELIGVRQRMHPQSEQSAQAESDEFLPTGSYSDSYAESQQWTQH
jgi:hypothetical protein